MGRARVIVQEIFIQKKGEIQFFQIKFPKNIVCIRGVELDAFMISPMPGSSSSSSSSSGEGGSSDPTGSHPGTPEPPPVDRSPFLKWKAQGNPTLGKLKLQSLDTYSIFFESWVPFVYLGAGMPDMSYGLFPKSPYSLNTDGAPRGMSLPCESHLINGMFEDIFGEANNTDLSYRIKVFVWIETSENSRGIRNDFEKEQSGVELQLKN